MVDELREAVRVAGEMRLARDERAQRIADLIRTSTDRRWVGIYEVTPAEVVHLAWSGHSTSRTSTDAFSDDDRRPFERVAGELVSLYL
jgi:hypothetical protein